MPPITLHSGVTIFIRFNGEREVTHLIYVKIKPYLISLLSFGKNEMVSNFSFKK